MRAPAQAHSQAARGRPARPPLRVLAATLCAAAICAACGIPYESAPQSLQGPLPAQLTHSSVATPTTPTTLPSRRAAEGFFYYIRSSRLKQFPELIARPVTVSEVLQVLEDGPLPGDTGKGGIVTTDIPAGSQLTALGVVKGVAHIGLDTVYFGLPLSEAVFELGQIVDTVIGTFSGIQAVEFFYDGSPVVVVNGNGQTVTGPVNTLSYCVEAADGCPAPLKDGTTRAIR